MKINAMRSQKPFSSFDSIVIFRHMNFGEQLKKIRLIVGKMMSCSAHDCAHVDRVYNFCLTLAKGKKVDLQ
ncbi:hypothetical protein COY05_03695, partial [Candidatus Peregrinibacteria bacterium CG_4_10_14_0_2_um_filter_38_24]